MSATVEIREVTKRFGPVLAVDNVSLRIEAGEFLTLLGPSGCGKTTLLRMIAGFETPDAGTIAIGGSEVTHAPPHRRDVNQVFQGYALFPHLTVRENVAFGLRMQRRPPAEIDDRVARAIALVSLGGCEQRRPHELSGGQRQRVALARALAPQPAVLLLDEPLSALDARLRQSMQLELKRLQREVGTTFVLVTHDQTEALTMSDRIALVHQGRIEQVGPPDEIYRRPATAFAAEFIGEANVLEATLLAVEPGGARVQIRGGLEWLLRPGQWPAGAAQARLSVRPEKIHVSLRPLDEANAFGARVEEKVFRGAFNQFVLATEGGARLIALAAAETPRQPPIAVGAEVCCVVHAEDIVVVRP